MKQTKKSAKDKRLEKYTDAVQFKIPHPNYESRVMIAIIFDDLKPESLVTGRMCTGVEKHLDKVMDKWIERPTYKVSRKFVVFEDKTRLSISNEIFSHLKIDHKLPHLFENYYA